MRKKKQAISVRDNYSAHLISMAQGEIVFLEAVSWPGDRPSPVDMFGIHTGQTVYSVDLNDFFPSIPYCHSNSLKSEEKAVKSFRNQIKD